MKSAWVIKHNEPTWMMAEIFLSCTHSGLEIKWLPLVLPHPPFLLVVLLHPHLLNRLAFIGIFFFCIRAIILIWAGSLVQCSACCQGWSNHSVCHRTCSSCSVCHCVFRCRNLLFPLRVLNGTEEGLVGIGQVPAPCSDLCLSGVARMTAYFFPNISIVLGILDLFMGRVPKN